MNVYQALLRDGAAKRAALEVKEKAEMTQFVTVDRATLKQLITTLKNNIDCVRHEYETYWGHGLPTRKAQIDSMKESLDRHEASITAGRAALANAKSEEVYAYAYPNVHGGTLLTLQKQDDLENGIPLYARS